MADSSSLYGSSTPQGTVASSNYTTLYSGGNNFVPSGDNVIISGTLTVNGCAILTDCNNFSLLPFNAATVNAFGSATAVSIGGATGVTTIQNQLSTGNYLFPLADGANTQVLATDGNGVLYWANNNDFNTTYTINASATTGGANFNLVGSDATTDTIKFASGSGITVTRTDADTITITNTDPGSAGVTSITGTANQINVSSPTGAVTLSTPQDIATTSTPTFAGVNAGNITVGVSTDNTITTSTGNLVLDANSNLVNVTAAFQVGTDNLYVDSGKVGVNTTTPGQEFTISDGGDGYCQFGMTNTERTWLLTNNAGDDLISYSIYTPSTPPVNRLQFDATGGDQWFPSGKLGVGTNVPAVELDVDGSGQFTGDVAINGGDLTTTATTASLFSTNARTIQIGGAGTNNAATDNITLGVYGQTYAVYVNTLLTQRGITTKASGQYLNQTTTSPILIMSTTRTSMKSIVTITDDVTGAIHTVECLANRKGLAGGAFITIYGEVYSDAPLATFTVVNNGVSGLELYATLASTNSTDIYITRDSLGAVI